MWILKVAETLNVTSFCFFFFSFFVRDDFEKWKGVDGGMSRENVVTKSFLSFFFQNNRRRSQLLGSAFA